jgi:hypothetical protein
MIGTIDGSVDYSYLPCLRRSIQHILYMLSYLHISEYGSYKLCTSAAISTELEKDAQLIKLFRL